jgi:UDP-2,3-diacylglucosamine hydrolase
MNVRAVDTSLPQAAGYGAETASPLAIVCGGGAIAPAVADAVQRSGRRVVLFPLRGWADPAAVSRYPHHWIALAQVGDLVRKAQREGCRDLVFIGTALRPPIRSLRIDWTTIKLLPQIVRMYRGGDDHLLSGVARIFESLGFRVLGAHEVAPEILMPDGPIGALRPSQRDLADIDRALALLRAIGPFDVGQAAVVADNHVLAIEAAEGTDGLLAHVGELRAKGRIHTPAGTGVLVKAPKAGQDRRLDLPTIGPRTVAGAAAAGLAGVAVVAGSSIVAQPAGVADEADKAGLFVIGVRDEQPGR